MPANESKPVIKHIAIESNRVVCEVYKDKHGHWVIVWMSRNGASERIADPTAAKEHVARLLHGKIVTWERVRVLPE